MASNPFASLIGGLFGGNSATTSSPKNTFVSNAYANASKVKSGNPYTPATATSGGKSLVSAPQVASAPNATAARGTVPYIPATTTGGGKSLVPAQTSYVGGVQPSNASSYTPPTSSKSNNTPRDTFVQNAAATAPTFDAGMPSPDPYAASGIGGGADASSTAGGSSSSSGSAFGGGVSSPAGTGSDYRSQYLSMLGGIFSQDKLKSSQDELDRLRKDQSKTQLDERETEDRIMKNEQGQGLRTYKADLAENSRLSARKQADLAIAASPYESYINSALGAYKTAAEFEGEGSDPFTLSEGQVRYDSKGNVIAGSSGGTSLGANDPTVQAWAKGVSSGQYQIGNVPENIRNAVAQAVAGQPAGQKPEVQQAVQKASIMLGQNGQGGLIDNALAQIGPLTTGFVGKSSEGIAGTPSYILARAIDTIKANLGFQELAAMRAASPTGGALGSITERELQFLQSTVASLDQGQDAKTLKTNLEKVKTHYNTWLQAVQQANGAGGGAGSSGGFSTEW